MDKKEITLPAFIKSKEQGATVIWKSKSEDITPENWKEMTETQRLIYYSQNKYAQVNILEINIKETKMFIYMLNKSLSRNGRKVFIRNTTYNIIFAEGSTLKVNNKELLKQTMQEIFKYFNIHWISEILQEESYINHLVKANILKAILTNRIYNEETLVKKIASQVYRIKPEWRLFRDFLKTKAYDFAINDLADFTQDINHSFKEIIKAMKENDNERLSTMKDTLNNATILGTKVNFRWSTKRMNNEHLAMVKKINKAEFEKMSEEPIYDSVIDNDSIHTLRTEKEVFMEGEIMSHCLYVNYFRDIKDKSYMAFHMTTPEVCTIGIRINIERQPIIDQIRLRRNKLCKPETMEVVKTFIDNNAGYLMSVMKPSELPF